MIELHLDVVVADNETYYVDYNYTFQESTNTSHFEYHDDWYALNTYKRNESYDYHYNTFSYLDLSYYTPLIDHNRSFNYDYMTYDSYGEWVPNLLMYDTNPN